MAFTIQFLKAFNHAMLYEVGSFWNPNDPEVIAGLCGSREQKRKVGYVNIKEDRGGETKFGVAKNANPNVDIFNLTLDGAMLIYFEQYWLRAKCDKMYNDAVALVMFDVAVNHGVTRAAKFIQQAVGVTVDGILGPKTFNQIKCTNPEWIVVRIGDIRQDFYQGIVNRNPSQQKFMNGWTRRNTEVTQYAMDLLG